MPSSLSLELATSRGVINPPNRCDHRSAHVASIRTTPGQTDFYESPTNNARKLGRADGTWGALLVPHTQRVCPSGSA